MTWTTPQTFAVSEELAAAKMNTNVRDNLTALAPDGVTSASWTPVITGSTSGSTDAADTGREYRVGATQWAWARWVDFNILAPVDGALGTLSLALPVAVVGLSSSAQGGQIIGTWRWYDDDLIGNSESGMVFLNSSTTVRFARPIGGVVTHSSPFLPEAGDTFTVSLCYTVA